MKRLFVVAILAVSCFLTAPVAQAQTPVFAPNEISTSYGVSLMGASMGLVAKYANIAGRIADITGFSDGDNIRVKAGGSKGIVNIGYAYQINKTWSFGVTGGFNRLSYELSDNTGSIKPFAVNLFTVMNTAQANWFRTGNDVFGMYSKAGVGVMFANYALMKDTPDEETGTRVFPSGHLTAVGLEVGRGFRGFLELGMGMQGVVQMGIKARF